MGDRGNKRGGELAELKVAAKATEVGAQVSFPHGDSATYDLVIEFGNRVSRVQVKSATYQDGNSYKVAVARGGKKSDYSQADFDVLAVIVPYAIYLIPTVQLRRRKQVRVWRPGEIKVDGRSVCEWEAFREAWHLLRPSGTPRQK